MTQTHCPMPKQWIPLHHPQHHHHYHHWGRMWFYMQSEPEVCADSDGGRVLFTFHPAVLELFIFFSWAPVLLAQDRGDLGYTPMVLKACCMCSCHFWCVFTLFSPPVVYINSVAAPIPNDYSHKQPVSLWGPLEKDTDGTCDRPALTPHAHCHTQYHSKYL